MSDWSKNQPLNFRAETSPDSEELQASWCSLHRTYWEQSGPSGDSCCPQCGQRSGTTTSQTITGLNVGLQEVLDEHKISLRRRFEHVTEGTDGIGSRTLLNRIFTELYITEGQS
ncbi:hypothetical protein JOB18_030913 [Solea senegalensis]|uniref:FISNA domain-containing protein n=1 Tax=Solea senegalensis TaxID=28829 RepID=A0AAV6T9R5_SOLSE|nr:hypothetical protein JOB18_030913 [Solea senegalensis]